MRRIKKIVLFSLVCLSWPLIAEAQSTLKKWSVAVDNLAAYMLPEVIADYIDNSNSPQTLRPDYEVALDINPFFLRADLNGDGKPDYIILIRNLRNGKTGFLICTKSNRCAVIMAGIPVKNSAGFGEFDDLRSFRMEYWHVYEEKVFAGKPEARLPPKPLGEPIVFGQTDAGLPMFIIWTGGEFVVY